MGNVLNVRDRATRLRDIRAIAGRAMLDGPHDYIVEDLEGPLLDLAVANATGLAAVIHLVDNSISPFFECCVLSERGTLQYQFIPSRFWCQAGDIIEKEGVSIIRKGSVWTAECDGSVSTADAPLLAAMRVVVKKKFGDVVRM